MYMYMIHTCIHVIMYMMYMYVNTLGTIIMLIQCILTYLGTLVCGSNPTKGANYFSLCY